MRPPENSPTSLESISLWSSRRFALPQKLQNDDFRSRFLRRGRRQQIFSGGGGRKKWIKHGNSPFFNGKSDTDSAERRVQASWCHSGSLGRTFRSRADDRCCDNQSVASLISHAQRSHLTPPQEVQLFFFFFFFISLILFFLILEAMFCSAAQKHAAVFSLPVIRPFCLWPHYDKSPSCLRRRQLARRAQTTTAGKNTQRTQPHVLHKFFFFNCNLMLFFFFFICSLWANPNTSKQSFYLWLFSFYHLIWTRSFFSSATCLFTSGGK